MDYVFTLPEVTRRQPEDAPHPRVKLITGLNLFRIDGTFRQVELPEVDDFERADRVYLGGRRYVISETEANELIAAGYGDTVAPVED